jgi:two-component system, OmpR family, manganese sensing response regulator
VTDYFAIMLAHSVKRPFKSSEFISGTQQSVCCCQEKCVSLESSLLTGWQEAALAKILLAEDDVQTCRTVAAWLEGEHYIVEIAYDGVDANERLKLGQFELLILDWDMPQLSGLEVCQQFRKAGGTAPVLMLTGKTRTSEKEQGLDSGADDYLTKPFELRELSARIRALLRRPAIVVSDVLKCRDLELHVNSREVRKNGKVIEFLPRELAVLEFLLRNANQVFSIEALQTRIWVSDSETSPDALRVYIARIRRKLDDHGDSPIIKTIRGGGYMLDNRE